MHRPGSDANLETAKHRMAFEELFLLQLKLLLRREVDRTPRCETDIEGIRLQRLDMMQAGIDAMGFTLTPAQDRVLAEVLLLHLASKFFSLRCSLVKHTAEAYGHELWGALVLD